MSKGDLIAAIRNLNRTVSQEFLDRFNETDLKAYLDRICEVATKRQAPPPTLQTTIDSHQDLIVT